MYCTWTQHTLPLHNTILTQLLYLSNFVVGCINYHSIKFCHILYIVNQIRKKTRNYPFIKISQVNPRLIQPTSFLWILCKINQKHNPLFSHNLFALLTHFLGQFTSFSFFKFVNAGLRLVTHLSTSPVSADLKQDKEEHHYTVNTKSMAESTTSLFTESNHLLTEVIR